MADLTARQTRALAALLSAPSVAKAAKVAGVHERTLRGWIHDDTTFQAAFAQARAAVVERNTTRLQRASTRAISELLKLLRATTPTGQPDNPVRVRAALGVLQHALRAEEVQALSDRVKALEARLVPGPEPPGNTRISEA